MKVTEKHIQAILMHWVSVYKNHEAWVTNSTGMTGWEADLLSWTRSFYMHEFEIKLDIYDFRAEFKKKRKHQELRDPLMSYCPNYFWFVTFNFTFRNPPAYAGWIHITEVDEHFRVYFKKKAPLLHKKKMPSERFNRQIRRYLSARLATTYFKSTVAGKEIIY